MHSPCPSHVHTNMHSLSVFACSNSHLIAEGPIYVDTEIMFAFSVSHRYGFITKHGLTAPVHQAILPLPTNTPSIQCCITKAPDVGYLVCCWGRLLETDAGATAPPCFEDLCRGAALDPRCDLYCWKIILEKGRSSVQLLISPVNTALPTLRSQ